MIKRLVQAIAIASIGLAVCAGSPAQRSNSEPGYWPQWRGPAFNGVAPGEAPTEWNDKKNVKWKTAIPGRGFSTPAIWGDRIFVTTAIPTGRPAAPEPQPQAPPEGQGRGRGPGNATPQVEHKFDVLCLNRKTGAIVWQRTAKVAVPHEGYHRAYGSFASNSPVTDGSYVYAFFGSRGIYCYDMKGTPVWSKDLGVQMKVRLQFGEGTAPVLAGNTLLLDFDHQGESFLVALDKKTGKELWKTPREEQTNWSPPLVVDHGGQKQVVVSATGKVRSYDLQTGKQIWECAGLGLNTIPAPVSTGGMVYVMSGYRDPKLMAIRLGKQGDLTGTDAIVWTQTRGLSYTASPVLFDNRLYVVTDQGVISCFDATTGEPVYHQVRLPRAYSFKASPIGANGKLYLASENGDVVIVKMGDKPDVLATNTLEDQVFIASPVIAAGDLYLRSQTSLFCIGGGGGKK